MNRTLPTPFSRRFASFLTSALVTFVAACGGAEPTGTGEPPTTSPDTAKTATVQFAASVDATTRAKVVAFVGVGDSIGTSGAGKLATGSIALSPVVALNATGDALLAGLVAPDGTTALDAASTAQMLVRILLPIRVLESTPATTLAQTIAGHADFAALTDSITALARRGESFATSTPTIALGSLVATGAATSLQPAPSRAVRSVTNESVAEFTVYDDVEIIGAGAAPPAVAGGTITFKNTSFVPFSVQSSTDSRRAVVTGAAMCALCWPPGYSTGDGSVRANEDGPFTLTVKMDKELVIGQLVIDFANMLMTSIGIKFPNDAKTITEIYAAANKTGVLTDLMAGKQGYPAMVSAATTAAISAAPALFDLALAKGIVEAGIRSGVTKMVLSVLNRADQGIALLKAPITAVQAARYWDADPETVDACFEKFKLYGGCADSVKILTPSTEVGNLGGTHTILASVFDDKQRLMVGRQPDWVSSSSGIATIDAGGKLTAVDNGAVIATAKAGAKQDTVTVRVALSGTYTLTELNGKLLPGETYRDTLYVINTGGGSLTLSSDGSFGYGVSATGANLKNTQTFDEGSSGSGTYKVTGSSLRFFVEQKAGVIDSFSVAGITKNVISGTAHSDEGGASVVLKKQ